MPNFDAGSIVLGLGLNTANFTNGIAAIRASLTGFSAAGLAAGQQAGLGMQSYSVAVDEATRSQRLFGAAAAGIGIATLTAGLVKSVGVAREYETAFTGVLKTTDDFTNQVTGELNPAGAAFREELKRIAETSLGSFQDLAFGAELGGQLGIASDQLAQFSQTVINAAASTNLGIESAALQLGQLTNVFGIETDQQGDFIERFTSTIVELGNNSATTESNILDITDRIASAGRIAGISAQETAAIGAAFGSVGVNAEAGGTAIQRVLNNISIAVSQGGEDLERIAAGAGVSASEFAAAFEDDAATAFADFVKGLGEQGIDAVATLNDLGLGNERTITTFLNAAGASETLAKSIDLANIAYDENTALGTEAGRRAATFDEQVKNLRDVFDNLADTVGSKVLPVLSRIVVFLTENPAIIKVVVALIAGLAVALTVLGTAAIIATIPLVGLSLPILAIIAVTVAVIAAMFFFRDTLESIFFAIFEFTINVFNSVRDFFVNTWNSIRDFVVSAVQRIVLEAVIAFARVRDFIFNSISAVRNFISNTWNAITGFISGALSRIVSIITGGFNAAVALARSLPGRILGAIVSLNVRFVGFMRDTFNSAVSAVQNGISSIISFMTELPGRIISAIGNLAGLLVDAGKDMMLGLLNGIKDGASAVINQIGDIAGGIKDKFTGIFSIFSPSRVFKGYGENLIEGLAIGIGDTADLALRATEDIANAIARQPFAISEDIGVTPNSLSNLNSLGAGSGALAPAGAGLASAAPVTNVIVVTNDPLNILTEEQKRDIGEEIFGAIQDDIDSLGGLNQ